MTFHGILALIAVVVLPVGHAGLGQAAQGQATQGQAAQAQATQDKRVYKTADAAVQELVREALADRFSKGDIPDLGLLPDKQSVLVLREMYEAGLTLGPEALPNLPGVSFTLIAQDAAQERANATNEKVPYITVDRPSIAGNKATVMIGVDFSMPADPKMIKLCCCVGEGHFEKREGQWRFVKWGVSVCS